MNMLMYMYVLKCMVMFMPMSMYTYIYICLCICMCICRYVHVYVCVQIYTHMHTCTYRSSPRSSPGEIRHNLRAFFASSSLKYSYCQRPQNLSIQSIEFPALGLGPRVQHEGKHQGELLLNSMVKLKDPVGSWYLPPYSVSKPCRMRTTDPS